MSEEKKSKKEHKVRPKTERFKFCPNENCSQLLSLSIDSKDGKNSKEIKTAKSSGKIVKDSKEGKESKIDKTDKLLVYYCSHCGPIKTLDNNKCFSILP